MADAKLVEIGLGVGSSTPVIASFTLNGSTDILVYVFQAPEAATITGILLRQTTATGTAPTYRVSLQGVDSSGIEDGSIKASGNAYVDTTPTSGNNNTMLRLALGTSYTCARGEMLAIVVAYQSGTIDGSNNCSFSSTHSLSHIPGIPYAIQNDAGTRTRQAASANIGYYSSSKTYLPTAETVTGLSFSSASTPDERGLKFTLPSGWGSTYQLLGARWLGTLPTGGSYDLVLYDSDGTTVLQSETMDTDHDQSAGSLRMRQVIFDEVTLSTLFFGTAYRLVLKPTSGSLSVYEWTVDAAGDLTGWPLGSDACYTSRTDAGSWTDDAAKRLAFASLILSDITEPSGGSGGIIVNRPMTGGMV